MTKLNYNIDMDRMMTLDDTHNMRQQTGNKTRGDTDYLYRR